MAGACLIVLLALASSHLAAQPPTPTTSSCHQTAAAWSSGSAYATTQFGNYFVSNNNWNNTPDQTIWAASEGCFGVTTKAVAERSGIGSYPHVVRGWMQNDYDMRKGSSAGKFDWTGKSGLGIPVTRLTKANVHWAFVAPMENGSRWNALQDIYFHKSATPAPGEFPPALDLQVIQSVADQVIGSSTYYAIVAARDHPATVTIGGNKYLLFVDDPGSNGFHQPGGHTITLFNSPTAFNSNNNTAIWGTADGVTDLAAIVRFFMRPHPVDDNGRALQYASGNVIDSALITPDLYLTSINAGWEIDVGTVFKTTAFCVSVQNEPDCH